MCTHAHHAYIHRKVEGCVKCLWRLILDARHMGDFYFLLYCPLVFFLRYNGHELLLKVGKNLKRLVWLLSRE